MEPMFARPEFSALIPQYFVRLKDDIEPISILAIGHRLADAVFRGTTIRESIVTAFKTFAKGNALDIAMLGPTSLVFGVWDSRGTGVKIPRLINSIIRAFHVVPLRRSAQYTPPIKYKQEGLLPDDLAVKPSKYGLADVPSPLKIGGVQINGDIRRDCSLNLASLRTLKGTTPDETTKLQRYVLGLALLALTATPEPTLRQGCQLLPKGKPAWKRFLATGDESDWDPENLKIADFATAAASDFGVVQPPNQPLVFNKALLKESIDADAKKKADKNASNESPVDVISKLVGTLKVSSNGKKINDAPLKKLNEYLDGFADGPIKAMAESIKIVLSSEVAPQEKIDKLKKITEQAKSTESADSAPARPESENATEEAVQ
jgi:CRISPR-associated protein Csb1